MSPLHHHILHAEDDPNDALLIQMSFRKAGATAPITVMEDGARVIDYLKGEGEFANRQRHPLPTVALLDIKIPRYSGLEVLEWIRSQSRFAALPVIIFSSSRNLADIRRAYELGVNAYIVKAVEYDELQATVKALHSFWIQKNVLPI